MYKGANVRGPSGTGPLAFIRPGIGIFPPNKLQLDLNTCMENLKVMLRKTSRNPRGGAII